MSAKHTPEPWEMMKSGKEECIYLHEKLTADKTEARGWRIADIVAGNEEANARRIVAAVNACAGIPTEALEAGVVGEMLHILEHPPRNIAIFTEAMRDLVAKAKGESP